MTVKVESSMTGPFAVVVTIVGCGELFAAGVALSGLTFGEDVLSFRLSEALDTFDEASEISSASFIFGEILVTFKPRCLSLIK